jgi:hypothetical protein
MVAIIGIEMVLRWVSFGGNGSGVIMIIAYYQNVQKVLEIFCCANNRMTSQLAMSNSNESVALVNGTKFTAWRSQDLTLLINTGFARSFLSNCIFLQQNLPLES